ncbi:MAG: hypothetical protein ACTHLW_08805 [Verrucomicrobiota bacterium]
MELFGAASQQTLTPGAQSMAPQVAIVRDMWLTGFDALNRR